MLQNVRHAWYNEDANSSLSRDWILPVRILVSLVSRTTILIAKFFILFASAGNVKSQHLGKGMLASQKE